MTEPLTPPDCDLRDFAYMPLDAGRLLDSDLFALSTGEEFKAALALWCKAWQQIPAASLPSDDRVLAHLSGAGARWKKVKEMALRGFVLCSDGRLYHPVVAEKANEAWKKKQSYRDRSKKGNNARWKSQKDGETDPSGITKGPLKESLSLPSVEEEGKSSVDKSTAAETAPPDPEKVMFDAGVRLITGQGKSEAQARSLIGKWRKNRSSGEVIDALGAAQREGVIDVVAFIEGRWRADQKLNGGSGLPLC